MDPARSAITQSHSGIAFWTISLIILTALGNAWVAWSAHGGPSTIMFLLLVPHPPPLSPNLHMSLIFALTIGILGIATEVSSKFAFATTFFEFRSNS